jgi:hypothetical protein
MAIADTVTTGNTLPIGGPTSIQHLDEDLAAHEQRSTRSLRSA